MTEHEYRLAVLRTEAGARADLRQVLADFWGRVSCGAFLALAVLLALPAPAGAQGFGFPGRLAEAATFDGALQTVVYDTSTSPAGVQRMSLTTAISAAFQCSDLVAGAGIAIDCLTNTITSSFDLHDDVGRSRSLLGGSDRFLFSDEGDSGDPNTFITFTSLANQVRTDIRLPNSSSLPSAEFIQFTGAGVSAATSGGGVTFTFTGGTAGLSAVATDADLTGDGTSGSPLGIAAAIARDSELPRVVLGANQNMLSVLASGSTRPITYTLSGLRVVDGVETEADISISGELAINYTGTDNVVTGGSVSGTTLTLDRVEGGSVSITGLPSGGSGTADGVADSVDLTQDGRDLTVTLGRSGTLADLDDTLSLRLHYRGIASSSDTDYVRGDIVAMPFDGRVFLCTATGEYSRNDILTGTSWIQIADEERFRGIAPVASTDYVSGDWVTVSGQPGALYLAEVTGEYTAAQVVSSSDWFRVADSNNYATSVNLSRSGDTISLVINRLGLTAIQDSVSIPLPDGVALSLGFGVTTGTYRNLALSRSGGLTPLQATINADAFDSEILDWAEQGSTAIIPANKQGQTPALGEFLSLPSSLTTPVWTALPDDDYVTAGSVSGTALTLTRAEGGTVLITGLPSGGGDDGVVESAAFTGRALTLERTQSLVDVPATIPADAFDDRIEDWAEEGDTELLPTGKLGTSSTAFDFLTISNGNSGTWRTLVGARTGVSGDQAMFVQSGVVATAADLPDGYIPDAVARDSELPIVAGGSNVTVTPSGTDRPITYTIASSGGGGGGDFDLHDDVADEHTTLHLADRLLVSAEDVAGDPNRYATYETILEEIRPRAADEGTLLTDHTAGINCVGDGITCTVNANNSVSIAVPSAAAGDIVLTRTARGSVDLTASIVVPETLDLNAELADGTFYEFRASDGNVILGHMLISGNELRALPANSVRPQTLANSLALKTGIEGVTSLTAFGHSTVYIWRGDDFESLWAREPRQRAITVTVHQLTLSGGGSGGGADDGVVSAATFTNRELSLTRTVGNPVTATIVDSAFDDRIATYARATNPSGQVPINRGGTNASTAAAARTNLGTHDAGNITGGVLNVNRLPAANALDSEIPTLPGTVTQAEAEAGSVTATRLWTPQRVSQAIAALAPAGSGGGDVTGIDDGHAIRIDDGGTATPEVNFDPSVGVNAHTTNFNANDRILLTAFGVNGTLRYAPYSQFSTSARDQIATWARASNPTGTAPAARLPAISALSGTLTSTQFADGTIHGGRLFDNTIADVKIDGLSASKLTGTIADARIPAAIARDAELPIVAAGSGVSVTPSGTARPITYTVAATGGGGTADGVADSLDLAQSGADLTVTIGRSGTLADLAETVTLQDGYVTAGAITGTNLLLGRAGGLATLTVNVSSIRGDVTEVTAGEGLCGGGDAGDVDLTLCAVELSTPVGALEADDEIVMVDQGESGDPTVAYPLTDLVTYLASGDANLDATGGVLSLLAAYRGAYDEDTIYNVGDIVMHDSEAWLSAANNNEGNEPARASAQWDLLTDDASDVASALAAGTGDGLQAVSPGPGLQLHIQELPAIGSAYSTNDLLFVTNVTGANTSENRSDTVSDWLDRTAGDGLQRDGTELRIGQGDVVSTMLQSGIGLIGNPTAPTQSEANDSTRIATTAFVHDVHAAADSITATQLAADSVGSSEIEAGAVQSSEIANDGIDTEDYAPGSVDTAALAAASVTEAKIADDAVTEETIADGAVTTIKIAGAAVTGAKLGLNSVGGSNILPNAVQSSDIAAGAVDNSDLATNAVSTSKIQNGEVNTVDLADNAVTDAKIADNSVGANQIRTGRGMVDTDGDFELNCYSFMPLVRADSDGARFDPAHALPSVPGDGCIIPVFDLANFVGGDSVHWDFMMSSDRPSIWVLLDQDGVVAGIWESEDPVRTPDTISPIRVPINEDGEPSAGYSVLRVGTPTLSVVSALYAGLETSERLVALSCTADYVSGRGWLSALDTIDALAGISNRYRPASRLWAVRCVAEALGVTTSVVYRDRLIVQSGTWALSVE